MYQAISSILVVINILQPDKLKPKAWKRGQDLVVLCLRPNWGDDEALAEDIDALGSLQVALDMQNCTCSWNLQLAEDLIGKGADDLHNAITVLLHLLLRLLLCVHAKRPTSLRPCEQAAASAAASASAASMAWGCHESRTPGILTGARRLEPKRLESKWLRLTPA
jgi:hypothetical protein